jgi:hypothetical protein
MAPGAGRRGALVGVYLVALSCGYVLGGRGLFPIHPFPKATSSPLAHLGVALSSEPLSLSRAGWDGLRADIEAVRVGEPPERRAVLDMVVAARGLASGGVPVWSQAEERCRALRWPRCDRPALEALGRWSRP